ncbi:MAG: hypothetical protein HQK62_07275 [Desulfamplus sp.]|nr:hypothetical protein [Desulfamplus sp.]
MKKWLDRLKAIQTPEPEKSNIQMKQINLDFNSAPLQWTEKSKGLPEKDVQQITVQKMETCLHGEVCLYLNNQNYCKRVNVSVFSLNECPLPKSKWFSVKH